MACERLQEIHHLSFSPPYAILKYLESSQWRMVFKIPQRVPTDFQAWIQLGYYPVEIEPS